MIRTPSIAAWRFVIAWAFAATAAQPALAASEAALESRIRSALREFAVFHSGAAPESISIPDLQDFAAPDLDPGRARIELSANPRNDWSGRVPVTVAVRAQDREYKRGVVTLRISERRSAWAIARNVERGDPLLPADLVRVDVEASELPEDALLRPGDARGLVARRSLAEGTVLRERWLQRESLVERGQIVVLRLIRGALRIEGRGKARDEGAEGEWIRVRNLDSHRELRGRVARDGAIDVHF